MTFHSDLFGWDYVWRNFADEKGGKAIDNAQGAGLSALSVPATTHTLIYTPYVLHGKKRGKGTTLAASFQPSDQFFFTIQTERWTSLVGKVFGSREVSVGDQPFDAKFLIRGNDEGRIQKLFGNATLRESLLLQPPSHFSIETNQSRYDSEWKLSSDSHVLLYTYDHLMEKIDQLETAYIVMTSMLGQLAGNGVIARENGQPAQLDFAVEEPVAPPRRLHSPLLDRP